MKIKTIFSLLLLLISLNILFSFLHYEILNIEFLQENELSKNITNTQVIIKSEYLDKKTVYSNVFFITLNQFLKIIVISSILFIGLLYFNIKVKLKKLVFIVISLEYVFLLSIPFEIIYFKFFNTSATLEEIQYFYPLSALNIVGYQGLDSWFIYPLQVLNLFELAYWLLLAYFIGKLAFTSKDKGKPMDLGFKIVATSYGSALLLWVVVVMFFTLSYS